MYFNYNIFLIVLYVLAAPQFVCSISFLDKVEEARTISLKDNIKHAANTVKRQANTTSGDYCFADQKGLDGPLNKLLVYAPMSPNQMNVKFLLFTCNNKDNSDNFTYLSESNEWKNSNFDPTKMTRFIVHGWLEGYPGNNAGYNWMEEMKNLFLEKSCINVIAVDWSLPARSVYYYQSAANTRTVGKMIGCVINKLSADLNFSPKNVDLVGHSLGAQVVGFAGKAVTNPKCRRIVGADPAGPGFQQYGDKDKLALTDADCVTVIHTNGARVKAIDIIDGLGHFAPLGHFDFYPNGGHKQPGCEKDELTENLIGDLFTSPNNTISNVEDLPLCNHVRSNHYAIADQKYVSGKKCQIVGYVCSSYDDFNLGKCADCYSNGTGCRPMPFDLDYWDDTTHYDSNAVHVKYYLNTGDALSEPQSMYCLFHYQIIVIIKSAVNPCLGKITIKLNNKEIVVTLGLKNQLDSSDGNKKITHLFTDTSELGDITDAQVTPGIGFTCSVNQIQLNYMSNLDDSVRKSMSTTLSSTDGKTFTKNR